MNKIILIILFRKWKSDYQSGLYYELFFRQLSAIGFKRYLDKTSDPFHKDAWNLFTQLEEYAFQEMAQLRKRRDIDTNTSSLMHVLSFLMVRALLWFPSLTFKAIESSASRFITQLETIKSLGPVEDQDYLNFMISHEQTLLDFLSHYNSGNREKALRIFREKHFEYYPKI